MGTEDDFVLHELMEKPLLNEDKILQKLSDIRLINIQNKAGETPLMIGIVNGHDRLCADIMDICVGKADVALKDNNENTLLHYFCRYGVTKKIDDILDKMKESQVEVWCLNKQKETPLHHVRNAVLAQKLLNLYKEPGSRPPESKKSELFTNIEDHIKNFETLKKFNFKEVINSFCNESSQYPVPRDITEIITFLLKSAKKNKPAVLEILGTVLRFGHEYINSTHVTKCMGMVDDREIFEQLIGNCQDPAHIAKIAKSTILKSVANKKNSSHYFSVLKPLALVNVNIADVTDDIGRNFAHYVCKSGSLVFLSELKNITPTSAVRSLLSATDNDGNYPVESLRDNTTPEFLKELLRYATEQQIDVTRAKSSLDLTHHALIKSKHPLFTQLLVTGFPVTVDGHGKTLLHQVAKMQLRNAVDLCRTVLQKSEGDYIHTTDTMDYTALDYALFYYTKDQKGLVEFLVHKEVRLNPDVSNKIIHFLAREDKVDKESLHCLSDVLGIEYPEQINPDFADDIKLVKREVAREVDTQGPLKPSVSLKPLLNILVFQPLSMFNQPPDGGLNARYSDEQRIVNFHHVPLEVFSLDHVKLFGSLVNKRILIISHSPNNGTLPDLLSMLFEVESRFVVTCPTLDNVPTVLPALGLPSAFPDRPPALLDIPDNQISDQLPENMDQEVETLRKAGYVYQVTAGKVKYYTPSIFGALSTSPTSPTSPAHQDVLAKMRLLDVSYDKEGNKVYITPSVLDSDLGNSFEGVVTAVGGFNVSRCAAPFIRSRLITNNMMTPSSNKLIMIDPDIFVSVGYQDTTDYIKISYNTYNNTPSEKICFESYLKKTIGNMFAVNPKWKVEWDVPAMKEYTSQEDDMAEEEMELLDVERADDVLRGESLFLSCDVTRLSDGIVSSKHGDTLIQRYFSSYARDCDLLKDGAGGERLLIRRLLYRIIQTRGRYTIRQFVQDGKWGSSRAKICALIGIDVVQSYTKMENLWRASKVDFIVLLIGTLVVLGIIIGCNEADIDLESYGVAGLTTLPFIVAVLRKLIGAYTMQSSEDYQKVKEQELEVE